MSKPAVDENAISVRELDVRYGDLHALDSVAFTVPTGSACALVGRNGAGKSTCLRVLAGLQSTATGVVSVLNSSPFSSSFRKADVGFLLDDQALFAYLTGPETLNFVASLYGVPSAERARRCSDLLSFFDLDSNPTQMVDEYSTGMARRLALAAALVHAPRLLILDEPFETLDPIIVNRLKRLLSSFIRGGGTMLVSSHLIAVVEAICDRVIILDEGRVVVSGSIEEVVRAAKSAGATNLEQAYVSAVETANDVPEMTWLCAAH